MNIEKYLNENYDFRYNEVSSRTIYKNKEKEGFKLLDDYRFNSLFRETRNKDIKVNVGNLRSLLASDFVPKYDPFKQFFNSLPKWDRKADYIEELASTVVTTDDGFFRWAFKKWLVALVGCAINPEISNHSVLILTGAQGTGKTTWFKNLLPAQLQEYEFSGNINPHHKDSTILLSEKLLINLDEMSSYSKSKVEAFKELITKDIITERRPYGHFNENYIRRASFCGSSNTNEILMDVTGNRRFLVNEAISFNNQHSVDLNLVYSQAKTLLDDGFKHYFDLEDIAVVEKNNERYKQTSSEEEYLEKFFEVPTNANKDSAKRMNATEVADYMKTNISGYYKFDITNLGKLLKAKGYPDGKVNGIKKYYVIIK